MRIHSIELARASRAYGLRLIRQAPATTGASRPSPAARAPDQLVGASVREPVTFDSHHPARTTPPAVLPLYTRAADMVEVATVIHLGRSVDLTG